MSTTYTPDYDHAWVTDVVLPSDGDRPTAASVNVPLETIADQVAWLKRFSVILGDRSADFSDPSQMAVNLGVAAWNADARWTKSNVYVWTQTSVASAGGLAFEVIVPVMANGYGQGVYLVNAFAYIKGAGAHVGLPATMPKMSIYAVPYGPASGAVTLLNAQVDLAPNTVTYQAYHELYAEDIVTATDLAGCRIIVEITGETGANALVGLELDGIRLDLSSTPAT